MEDILGLQNRITALREEVNQSIVSLAAPIGKIAKIASEIFGEDFVSYVQGESFIIIHFPQMDMTNSRGDKHTIYDLYVKINVTNDVSRRRIIFRGTRSSVTAEEYNSNYCHSHLEQRSYRGSFNEFCVGTGPFFDVLNRVREYATSDIDSWYLLFYSLPTYLSWESLEGGPYIGFGEIRPPNLPISSIADRMFQEVSKEIPINCLHFSDGEVRVDSGHPELIKLYDKHFARVVTESYTDEARQKDYEGHFDSFMFKRRNVRPRILPSTPQATSRTPLNIINALSSRLTDKVNQFNKTFIHDINKSLYGSRLGEVPVL